MDIIKALFSHAMLSAASARGDETKNAQNFDSSLGSEEQCVQNETQNSS